MATPANPRQEVIGEIIHIEILPDGIAVTKELSELMAHRIQENFANSLFPDSVALGPVEVEVHFRQSVHDPLAQRPHARASAVVYRKN